MGFLIQLTRLPPSSTETGALSPDASATWANSESQVLILKSQFSNLQHNLAVILTILQQLVSFHSSVKRQDLSDHRGQPAFGDPLGELLPCGFHDLALLREVSQPQALDASRLCIQCPHIELRGLARGAA